MPYFLQNGFNCVRKFASLELLVLHYPFLVREHPLQPVLCFKKMTAWEEAIFASMKPEDAAKLRKSKSIEITRTSIPDIPGHNAAEPVAKLCRSCT